MSLLSHRPLQALVLFLAMVFSPSHEQKDHAIYYNNGFNETNFSMDGIAFIHCNGHWQLTNTSSQEMGHAFYSSPVPFEDNSTHGVAVVPKYPNLSAHGLAITISPSMEFPEAMASQ